MSPKTHQKCCIPGCKSSVPPFHRFPANLSETLKWLEQINDPILWENAYKLSGYAVNYRVCDIHFEDGCKNGNRLVSGSVPTLHLHGFPNISIEHSYSIASRNNSSDGRESSNDKIYSEINSCPLDEASSDEITEMSETNSIIEFETSLEDVEVCLNVIDSLEECEEDLTMLEATPEMPDVFTEHSYSMASKILDAAYEEIAVIPEIESVIELETSSEDLEEVEMPLNGMDTALEHVEELNEFEPNHDTFLQNENKLCPKIRQKCCIRGCISNLPPFHRFPANLSETFKWLHEINDSKLRENAYHLSGYSVNHRVCDAHFADSCKSGNRLIMGSIPSLCLQDNVKQI